METCDSRHLEASDNGHGEYFNETREAAGKNEEAVDDYLLHGDRSTSGIHHGLGFKGLGIEIMPEEENVRKLRRRKR